MTSTAARPSADLPSVDTYPINGLSDKVEIVVDNWGVPHIFARSREDAFVAQGFNAARDRLFQIDLWRRRGHGLLSEALGASYVEQDRASRLFLYRGDLDAEWLAYGPETKTIVCAFVRGVNAYVAWACEDPARLPPEFEVHGYLPSPWEPTDAILFRTHGLFYNVEQEIARVQTVRDFGPDAEEVRQAREPSDPLQVPSGLDLSLIGEDVMRVYRLAFSPVEFTGQSEPHDWREGISGSNNWAIAAERSTTGRPVLANDPHRALTLPSLRYMAHLEAPGLSLIGAGEPGLPGISIGHNGRIAFGLTIWPADHEDLYVYELDPEDSSRYRYGDGWEPFRTESDRIPVRGADPVHVEYLFTRHGPVIFHDVERRFAVAVRAVWLQPGMAPYLASIAYADAGTGDDFVEALRRWGAPSVNQVFATPDGDIGWNAATRIPRRIGWDGSFPVPGDGRYEWGETVTTADLISIRRPACGWVMSANEMNLPDDYRNDELTTTYDWYSSARAQRLRTWLESGEPIGVENSVRMQSDAVSVDALRLIALVADAIDVKDSSVLERLRAWDGDERIDSYEALIFEVWFRRHLRPWLLHDYLTRRGLSDEVVRQSARLVLKDESFGGDLRGDLTMLSDLLASTGGPGRLAAAVESTIEDAFAEIVELLGPDPAAHSWGTLHHSLLVHPALEGMPGIPDGWARVGPAPRPGSGDTVGNAGYDADFRQSIGSTFRMVVDVGQWDSSRAVNAPGQSGDPRSRHYADLFELWAAGGSFPLLYSRAAIEANVDERIFLVPAE